MATVTVNTAHHAALVAATVDTVTLNAASQAVQVINRSGTAEVYFTVGSTAKPPAAPTVGGDDTFVVPAVAGAITSAASVNGQGGVPLVVKLISSGTPTYTVIGTR